MGFNLKKAEKEYLERLVRFGCVVCKKHLGCDTPPCIHHIRDGAGVGKRSSHFDTIPLCHAHHQGEYGVGFHSGKKIWEEKFGTERELQQWLKEKLDV